MAAKKHKAKKSSITKEAAAAAIAQCGVTKSWPPPSTRCDARQRPRLRHFPTSKESPNINPHCHFLVDGCSIAHAIYELPDAASPWCYLRWDTKPESFPPLTPPSDEPHSDTPRGLHLWLRGVSLAANAPTSAVVVDYTLGRPSFWYRQTSIRHECKTPDPFDAEKKPMEFTNLLHFQGKYYATSLQGALAVMQVIDTRLRITAVGPTRGVPSSDSRFFRECLLEMSGEILLVFLIHEKSVAVVDFVEVFRLDLKKLCWIKVERLKGRAMFLDERCSCVWVESEELGRKDDRVYFTEGVEKKWKVFDMKTCCISPVSPEWS